MTISVGAILAIAAASSVFTAALAVALYFVWARPRLDARLLQIQAEFEQHVKRGVLAAGTELLPALREQVTLGFQDALKGSHAVGIAEGTAKLVTGSTERFVDSLNNLFGMKKK